MSNNEIWSRKASFEDALTMGLTENEYKGILQLMERDINLVELGIFSALYSEHCSYKSSKIHLKTLPVTGKRVIQGPGENAGIVDIGDGEGVAFKIESHNHPSYIEPFQGAATGVGGILRDVFTMGARPLALLNSLRFGDLDHPKTKYLTRRAVSGIGSYGNCMGIPTIGGELFFHKSYNGNCLVNAFALGLVKKDEIFLGTASGIGNKIFYVGSKTGRDGIHGATMASEEFSESSEEKRPTVQVGDPFQEKLLLEACLEVMKTGAVVGIQDMGAAGLTSSSFEMAERGGAGVVIYLDKVPQREENMNPYELMLSESQERMLLVAKQGREEEISGKFKKWGMDCVEIGEVVDGDKVTLYWNGEIVSSIPVHLVTSSVPQYNWPHSPPEDFITNSTFDVTTISEPDDLNKVWKNLLSSVNLCSRSPVYEQYDSTVRTNTVVHPGGDAAVIRIKSDTRAYEKGIAITLDCNSRYCSIDPRQGTALSIAEAIRNVSAVGAEPIGISNCLNFGSPERPSSMWELAESIAGLGEAARTFEVPVVSGNVSLYNETKGSPILPTPEIALVGLIDDASKCVDIFFKEEGDIILVLGETREELGGSEYMAFQFDIEKGKLPNLDYDKEIKTAKLVRDLISQKLLQSCHDISSGGLAIALTESCLNQHKLFGADLYEIFYKGRSDALLFGETQSRYIISASTKNIEAVKKQIQKVGIQITAEGAVSTKKIKIGDVAEIDSEEALKLWRDTLKEEVFN